MLAPQTPQELADALGEHAARRQTITLIGHSSKRLMAGPVAAADVTITTCGLQRVLQYEPGDLTISVEAGLPWTEFTRITAAHRQIAPLDPPYSETATIGGVVAANTSGPRRRLYGTARDLIIGMQFATLEGKLIQSGGMVVKNVAGLDMAKLMIGSFGTLAAISVVNFKLAPAPEQEGTFLLSFGSLDQAMAARAGILKSYLQPSALDLLNPACAGSLGSPSWTLAVRAGGSTAVIARYERELARFGESAVLQEAQQREFWNRVQDFTPRFLGRHAEAVVVRASCTLKGVEEVLASFPGPALARAGSGVCYGYFDDPAAAERWLYEAAERGWKAVIEFAPEERKRGIDLWPAPGTDFELMRRIKNLFDPGMLLNRGRLYGRL